MRFRSKSSSRRGYDYESLLKELNVSRQGKSDYLQVSFRSDNPYLSEFAVNSFSEEFIRYYRNRLGSGSDDKLASLRQIMEAKRDTLEKRAKELAQIERRYGIVSSIDDRKSVVETISSYERMRDQERSKISALEGELAEIRRKLQDKGMLYDLDRTRQNRAELPRLTSLLTQVKERQAFGDNSPSLRDSISMLEQRKEDMLSEGNSMNSVQPQDAMEDLYRKKTNKEIELENAKARLSTIEENLGRQRGKKYSLMTGNSDLDRAQAMYGQAEKGYQAALIRYNDAKDKVKDLGQNLQIFERGRPAEKPEPSRAPILIAFSGLASLALCVVVLFLLEYVDLSIRTPSNFVRLSGLPLLGSLNHLNTSSLKLESLFSEKSNNPNLERYKQLLRKLRYEILNMGSHIMLFTSARSGEGKTLTMLSLAYSLSLNDKKILLIDTNFKGPTLTSMLQAKPVLEDAIRQGDDPARAVSRSEFPGIDVIGCRGGDYSPAEVLYDAEFRAMLKQLSESYDYIFMEGAPLNDFADAKELIHFNEKVVSVFSAKTVLKQSDKETIAYLQSLDDKFLGAILNNVEPQNLEL
jgi:succinoglycan biosynthesis transport protein ExoP